MTSPSSGRAALDLQRLLASLELGPASDAAVGRALTAMDPVEAAHALAALVGQVKRSPSAERALVIATRALSLASEAELPRSQRSDIYAAATEFGLTEVAALFVGGESARTVDPAAVRYVDPVIGHHTLGHKKMWARSADADRIARLSMEGDPEVVRELLRNPRLTEPDVVRLVARRPVRAEVLREVWRSTRWSVRLHVRRALALNPYTPPEIALKVLPHLTGPDLAAVAADGSLHEAARALAARLLEKRRASR